MDLTHFGIRGQKKEAEYAMLQELCKLLYLKVQEIMKEEVWLTSSIDISRISQTSIDFYAISMTSSPYGSPEWFRDIEEHKSKFSSLECHNLEEFKALTSKYTKFTYTAARKTSKIRNIIYDYDHYRLMYTYVNHKAVEIIAKQFTPEILEAIVEYYDQNYNYRILANTNLARFSINGNKLDLEYAVMQKLCLTLYFEVQELMKQETYSDIITIDTLDKITNDDITFFAVSMTATHYGCPRWFRVLEDYKEYLSLEYSTKDKINEFLLEYNKFFSVITPRIVKIYNIVHDYKYQKLTYDSKKKDEIDRITEQLTPEIVEAIIDYYGRT